MAKSFSFKMSFGLNSSLPLKYNLLLIIILYIYDCKCNALDMLSIPESAPYYTNFSALDNLLDLPKKYMMNLISKNTERYSSPYGDEDIFLNGTQLIQKYGYEVEEHHVITSDGYNLGLYRIPGKGRVVFLMHGILSSFVDWVTVGPDQGLPYLLAAQGYDVWMGNARGNTYSRKNNRLSPSDPAFWEFSFNEIGSKDLPAMIDYVLKKTEKKKLTYIGHSQGATAFFVLCSTKPEYNDKIDFMVALSAVAWMKHIPNPILKMGAYIHEFLYSLGKFLNLYEIAPDNDTKKALTLIFCGDVLFATIICQNIVFFIAGFNFAEINYNQLPIIFNHCPSGSSLMQFEHYAQLIVSGEFRPFDYGSNLNYKIYGSTTPPSYPIEKITAPIAIFYSQGDLLVSTLDLDNLHKKLKNVVSYSEVRLTTFNHVDFLWGKHVKRLVYDKVLALIKQNSLQIQ